VGQFGKLSHLRFFVVDLSKEADNVFEKYCIQRFSSLRVRRDGHVSESNH
jgi:hypothetical protein